MPERVLGDELGDGAFQLADLASDNGQQFIDEGHDSRVGDQAGLIELRGADLGELAQAGDQGTELQLAGRGETRRAGVLHLGEPCDHGRVQGIGFFHLTHALGEAAHRAWVEDGHRQALFPEQGEGSLLVASGGFHGHQLHLVGAAKGGQSVDAFGGVGKCAGRSVAADACL